MLVNVPLLIVPFIIFNIVGFGLIGSAGADPWAGEVMSITMISGELWTMSLGDLMITLSLFFLFFEIIKATRIGASSIIDHASFNFCIYRLPDRIFDHWICGPCGIFHFADYCFG